MSYADASSLKCIALKACSVMQSLLLEKHFSKSKTKDHVNCLDRRLKQWKNGDVKVLVNEDMQMQHLPPCMAFRRIFGALSAVSNCFSLTKSNTSFINSK